MLSDSNSLWCYDTLFKELPFSFAKFLINILVIHVQELALCSLMKLLQVESNHPLRKSDAKRYAFPVNVLNVSTVCSFQRCMKKMGHFQERCQGYKLNSFVVCTESDHKPVSGLELSRDYGVDAPSKVSKDFLRFTNGGAQSLTLTPCPLRPAAGATFRLLHA